MGPFVPEFISNELNLIVAFVVGIAFGFVLEQAGFSSSRRLAGQFYGYDFTVLRVFFTAGVTAMTGVLILGWAGLLDLDLIYVNPTWLWPAVVGGLIMGLGFVLGGYCPGTSVCAVAIGKIDAMWFVGGGFLGILLYGEFFSLYSEFHESSALGPLKIYETLGMPAGVFALLLIVVAVGAFIGTSYLEKRISKEAPAFRFPVKEHRYAMAALLVAGVLLLFLPDRKTGTMEMVQKTEYKAKHPVQTMDVDEFAFRLLDRDPKLAIIDLRSSEAFKESPLPGSVSATLRDLFGKELLPLLSRRHVVKVFLADDIEKAEAAYRIADRLGFENIRVLDGGMKGFEAVILKHEGIEKANADTKRFRERAGTQLPVMMTEYKAKANRKPKVQKKIQGGC